MSQNKNFDFNQQNEIGKIGERWFEANFPNWTPNNNGKTKEEKSKVDFINAQGELLEVKTDTTTYSNFFIEKYSDNKKKTVGGPWQAQSKGAKYYCYYYLNQDKYYVMKVDELLKRVEELMSEIEYKPKYIKNKLGYWTEGYAMPRFRFQDLFIQDFD